MKLIGLISGRLQLAHPNGKGKHRDGEGQADEYESEGLVLKVALESVESAASDTEEMTNQRGSTICDRFCCCCT